MNHLFFLMKHVCKIQGKNNNYELFLLHRYILYWDEGCSLSFLQERDTIVRWSNLVDIFCGLTFYPLEHIAWARDKKLLHGKSDKLWDWSLYCWIGSLIACIVRDLWLLRKLHQQEKNKQLSRSDFLGWCF